MKYFRRYFSVLCVFLLLLTVSSLSVSAKSVDVPAITIKQTSAMDAGDGNGWSDAYYYFTPRNGETEKYLLMSSEHTKSTNNAMTIRVKHEVTAVDGGVLIPSGQTTTLTLKNFFTSFYFVVGGQDQLYNQSWTSKRLLLFYADGTMEYVENGTQNYYTFTFDSFTPKKNVTKFELICTQTVSTIKAGTVYKNASYMGEYSGDTWFEIEVNQEEENTGLLKGIIQWIKGIFNKIGDMFTVITSGFSDIGSKISNMFNSVVDGFKNIGTWFAELPSKLWTAISDGLKNLFVPDEQFISDYKVDFDELLAEKFGAVYQVVNLTFDSFDRIQNSDSTNTITFPATTINLPENNKFTFGGQEVKIVPDGFDFLVNTLKILVGIVCTILFINGLRKRYDEVMGVET